MKNPETGESLIEYPTYFTYKVIGHNNDQFEPIILELMHRVVPEIKEPHIERSYSRNKKYITLTIKAYVTNSEELHAIYDHLKNEERVLWAL